MLFHESVREAAEIIERLVEDEGLWEEFSATTRERALVFDGSVFERAIVRVVEKVSWENAEWALRLLVGLFG